MTHQQWYERRLVTIEKEIEKILGEFKENFYYHFKWRSEELYKLNVEKSFLTLITSGTHTIDEVIQTITHQLSYWTPEHSTSPLSNTQNDWDYEIKTRLLRDFKREN